MVNIYHAVRYIIDFMVDFVELVRMRFNFTYGFVTVNYFDVIIIVLLATLVLNVLWKGGRA